MNHDEGPFEGKAGKTRRVSLFFRGDSGPESASVYRVVNVATEPHLREAILSGSLHRSTPAESLAISFVVHDPVARHVILFVPEALRHREVAERAAWLAELAAEGDAFVPAYAVSPVVAVGVAALRQALMAPPSQASAALEESLKKREEAVVTREQRLRDRAEIITRREDELSERLEQAELGLREVEVQQAELETRLAALRDREVALGEREQAAEARSRSVPPPSVASMSFAAPRPRTFAPPSPIAEPEALIGDDADDVEELDELEPVHTNHGADVASLVSASATEVGANEAVADVGDEVVEDVEEVDDGDELDEAAEEIDDAMLETREEVTGLHAIEELAGSIPSELRDAELAIRLSPEPEVFVRSEGPLPEGEVELLVQLVPSMVSSDLRGLILITLVSADRKRIARAVADPRDPKDRAALEALRRRFEANIVFHDGRAILREQRLAAPREAVVARVLDRATRQRIDSALSAAVRAKAAALPLLLPDGHVLLGEAIRGVRSPAQALADLRAIQEASSSERLDDAVVHAGVAPEVAEATVAKVVDRALEVGLALGPVLLENVSARPGFGDSAVLVERLVRAFVETTKSAGHGLSTEAIASNWEQLLGMVSDAELTLDAPTHEQALAAIDGARGSSPSLPPALVEGALRGVGVPELLVGLDHPRVRVLAALELVDRKAVEHVEPICRAVRKMNRADVVRVVPRIVRLGDEAGDALIDGLGAKKSFVRQAFALAVGQLKLRRALVPLLHALLAEPSDAWRDMARVMGSFGSPALRGVLRPISEGKGPDERLARVLGHLALNGCEEAILAMRGDGDRRLARLAEEGLATRKECREREEMVAGSGPIDPSEGASLFARRFIEELEGRPSSIALTEEG